MTDESGARLSDIFRASYGPDWVRHVSNAQAVCERSVWRWVMGERSFALWRLYQLIDHLERCNEPIEQTRRAMYARADRIAEARKAARAGVLMRLRLVARGLAEIPGTRISRCGDHRADRREARHRARERLK